MAKSFKTLQDKMSPKAQEKSKEMLKQLKREMMLAELRNSLDVSQEELGALLNTKQAAISRLERRSDMHVSTLKAYVKALGGKLQVIASFPDEDYHIKQFEQETADDFLLT